MANNRRLFLAVGLAFAAAGLFVVTAKDLDWISTASGSERARGSERPLAKAPRAVASALATARGTDIAQDPAKQEIMQEPVVYVCPMHPDVNSKLPGQCHKCNMKLVASKAGAVGDFHICPMHPDVVSNQAGTCPKCNMKLVKTEPPETSEYIVRIKTNPAPPKAGQKLKLQFSIFHPVTGKQIKD